MTKPLISVIVPVYNVQKYLPMCLNSVLAQTFKDFELICVDDGSTDDSLKILQEYAAKDKRIKVIHQENQGVSAARNYGLSFAIGHYIYFMDSDDFILQKCFEKAAEIIDRYSPDCVMFDYREVGENEILNDEAPEVEVQKLENPFELFMQKHSLIYPNLWTKIYKAETIGKQRFDENMIYSEDLWFNLEFLAKAQTFYHLSQKMYAYVKRIDSITASKFTERKAHSFLQCCANIQKKFEKTPYFKTMRNNISNLNLKFVLKNLQKLPDKGKSCEKKIFELLRCGAIGYKNLPWKYKLKLWKIGRQYK